MKVVALCIVAAILYGIAHDQVTARVCIEYFTVGHPRFVATESPTVLAIVWGTFATWWVGLLLGIPLAFAARGGRRPERSARSLLRPIAILLVCMAIVALAAGVLGHLLATNGVVVLLEPFASRVAADRHDLFIADLWAHAASYLAGFVGGVLLIVRVWRSRKSMVPAAPISAPIEDASAARASAASTRGQARLSFAAYLVAVLITLFAVFADVVTLLRPRRLRRADSDGLGRGRAPLVRVGLASDADPWSRDRRPPVGGRPVGGVRRGSAPLVVRHQDLTDRARFHLGATAVICSDVSGVRSIFTSPARG